MYRPLPGLAACLRCSRSGSPLERERPWVGIAPTRAALMTAREAGARTRPVAS
jgi:hypothetical protein